VIRLAIPALALFPALLSAESAILAPTDKSIVPADVRIVARHDAKPELLIDGKPAVVESPLAGIVWANVRLALGSHEVQLAGGPKIQIYVGEGAPEGWQKFRPHPPGGAACATCHAVRNGEWAFAKASLVGVCFACHDRAAFPMTHTHEPGIVPDCQMCHSPHGSTAARHLKMAREAACKLCHN
jgi:predicted CXXCH cytochrome family protein